jgi:hypothetical protein
MTNRSTPEARALGLLLDDPNQGLARLEYERLARIERAAAAVFDQLAAGDGTATVTTGAFDELASALWGQ